MSSAKSPPLMQPHLRKVFENLVKLELEQDEITACGMISAEGEVVTLKNCVLRGGEAEEWVRSFQLSLNERCASSRNR